MDSELQSCHCILKLTLGKVRHQEVGSGNMWDAEPCPKKNKCLVHVAVRSTKYSRMFQAVNTYGFATLLTNQQLDLFGIVMKGAHHLFVGRKYSCTLPSGSTNDTTSPSPTTSGDCKHCVWKAEVKFYNRSSHINAGKLNYYYDWVHIDG